MTDYQGYSPFYKHKRGRREQRFPVPFREKLPLQLKNEVSGKGMKGSDVACLPEIFATFACFKENEFNQSMCKKQVDSLETCYMNHLKKKRQTKEASKAGIIVPGQSAKEMTAIQLNKFLCRFPHRIIK